mgnify:CR=1 FL=1
MQSGALRRLDVEISFNMLILPPVPRTDVILPRFPALRHDLRRLWRRTRGPAVNTAAPTPTRVVGRGCSGGGGRVCFEGADGEAP